MNRRSFLKALGLGTLGAAVAPYAFSIPQATAPIGTTTITATTAATFRAGDVITIAGRYALNPVTLKELPYLRQFVITADVTSDMASVPITPYVDGNWLVSRDAISPLFAYEKKTGIRSRAARMVA